ncbi:MAG: hypothetical protein JNM17_36725 [Archangium sp.]|nr:hypothetical protein [Archangium sp.]
MKRIAAILVVLGAAALFLFTRSTKPVEAPGRALFRKQLPGWVVARSRGEAPGDVAFEAMLTGAEPWPSVKAALEELGPAWPDEDRLKVAARDVNVALRDAGLDYWVDPMFPGRRPVLTTYEVLSRAVWTAEDSGVSTEAIHVRRLDRLNLELGLLGHAGGDQPAILRDRIEVNVLERLRVDPDEYPNEVDDTANTLWREQLARLVNVEELKEAEARVNRREVLLREMEKRLKGGKVHVQRPERLVFGDDYFETLEPLTSNTRRGGPLFLASDLRALQRADDALADTVGLRTLVQVIDLEASIVEAHEVRHALDKRDVPVPALLQRLVGEGDLRFGRMSERELRAFLGQLHDSKPPACLSVIALGQLARGRYASSTPHFFAAHALLATLGDLEAERGVSKEEVVKVMKDLCALPDAELRSRVENACVTLYGEALSEVRAPSP